MSCRDICLNLNNPYVMLSRDICLQKFNIRHRHLPRIIRLLRQGQPVIECSDVKSDNLYRPPSPAMRAGRALPFALHHFLAELIFGPLALAARLWWAAGDARRSSMARGRPGDARRPC